GAGGERGVALGALLDLVAQRAAAGEHEDDGEGEEHDADERDDREEDAAAQAAPRREVSGRDAAEGELEAGGGLGNARSLRPRPARRQAAALGGRRRGGEEALPLGVGPGAA